MDEFANGRTQLTLFVPEVDARSLEAARRVLDPVQASLIAAHVTLCRDEEAAEVTPAVLLARLAASGSGPITLLFGEPEPFGGHGILLPCVAGEEDFRALRHAVLGRSGLAPQVPHITLAHPRNPRAPGNDLASVSALVSGLCLTFTSVTRIRQEGLAPWRVLQEFPLGKRDPGTDPLPG